MSMLWRLRLPRSALDINVRESSQILFRREGILIFKKIKESVRCVGGFQGPRKIVTLRVFKG